MVGGRGFCSELRFLGGEDGGLHPSQGMADRVLYFAEGLEFVLVRVGGAVWDRNGLRFVQVLPS